MFRRHIVVSASLFAIFFMSLAGCDFDGDKVVEAFDQVFTPIYFQEVGPPIVTSTVGCAMTPNGWNAISALATEAAWRTEFTSKEADSGRPPSIFTPVKWQQAREAK